MDPEAALCDPASAESATGSASGGETEQNPFVGPRPFESVDAIRFYGRDGEGDVVTSLIIAHPIVLLYAQSGAGKTSLLNARVLPALEAQKIQVLGTVRVGGPVPRVVHNPFLFNTVMHLTGQDISESARLPSLTEFLRTLPAAAA